MEIRLTKILLPLLAALLVALLAMVGLGQARADSQTIDFENFSLGSPDGQQGWSSDGSAGSGCAVYDHEIDEVTSGPASFGTKALRMSNAVTSGCFGDQTFSSSLSDEAGETSAENGGLSGGDRQTRFETSWEFASTVPNAEQTDLSVVASPDRGDGARMSWVQMADTPDGLEVNFYDYQQDSPDDADGKFVFTNVANGLDRTVPHTIEITMDFIDGPANDIVTVTVDDTFTHTGTSWEDYFRDEEGNPTRTVDSVLFRTGGAAAPDTQDEGFFIDNLTLESSSPPPCTITGTEGSDVLQGTEGDDVICGLGGIDVIYDFEGGNDILMGGNDLDIILGYTGNTTYLGGEGDDFLIELDGVNANDTLDGEAGNDFCFADQGDARLNCES